MHVKPAQMPKSVTAFLPAHQVITIDDVFETNRDQTCGVARALAMGCLCAGSPMRRAARSWPLMAWGGYGGAASRLERYARAYLRTIVTTAGGTLRGSLRGTFSKLRLLSSPSKGGSGASGSNESLDALMPAPGPMPPALADTGAKPPTAQSHTLPPPSTPVGKVLSYSRVRPCLAAQSSGIRGNVLLTLDACFFFFFLRGHEWLLASAST